MQEPASPRESTDQGSRSELEAIADRYARRSVRADRFGPVAESERFPLFLSRIDSLGLPRRDVRLLEIGCGGGGNLRRFLTEGLSPDRLVGNELLPARVEAAKASLPPEVRIVEGDASALGLEAGSFDVVFASTVFTSILDAPLRHRVASAMWRLVRPGGAVLWYDFAFDNPRNPDVRGVKAAEVRALFPKGSPRIRRITLAPPIARACLRLPGSVGLLAYRALAALPPLRTHLVAWIEKPCD
ncbi:MAG: class I SAM-dependent methyltransferase [Phycisphaerales bacterium]|jgi:SAM-dependent methyltransferase